MTRIRTPLQKAVSILLAILMICMAIMLHPEIEASALSAKNKSGFTIPTLSGDQGEDVAAIASANLGKKSADFSYSGAWCAYFATDCAELAGVPNSVVPNYGSTTLFYENMINKRGATKIVTHEWNTSTVNVLSDPKPGDFILIRWDGMGYTDGKGVNSSGGKIESYCMDHTALVVSYNSSTKMVTYVGGNQGNGTNTTNPVSKESCSVTHKRIARIIRPKYTTNPDPISYANVDANTYYFKNASTGTYLSVDGAKAANGQNLSVAAKNTTAAFQFKITGGTEHYFYSMLNNDFVVNPYSDNPTAGVNVTLYQKDNTGTQIWKFEKVDDGYLIRLKWAENCVLAVSGTNVQLATANTSSKAQIWILESIADPLSSISITSSPTKKSYYLGETLKTDGMKVTATYESGKTKDVTSAVKTSYDFSKAGTATVTVSYTEDGVTKTAAFTVSVEETPVLFEGSGTETDPYLIQSKKDLETFRDAVNDTSLNPTYAHAYYLQTADIDLQEEEWIPIGVGYDGEDALGAYNYQTRMFYGVYDGGKHYIKGLKITKDYNESGLFGVLRDNKAMVCNLVVYGSVNNSYGNAGGICSTIHYGAVVQNCGFVGDITCKTNKSAGGVVSAIWASGTVSDCYHCGNVTSNGNAAGIIASTAFGQYNSDGDTALIQNCYHANGTISGKEHSGAIVAYCTYYDGINNTVTIKNCYASTDSGANADAEGATVNTTQLLRASEMKLLAEDLGSSFANAPDQNLNNGYPVFTWQIRVLGDISQDGVISVEDVIVMQKYLHAKQKITKAQFEVADVNSDGKVNVYDLALLKRKLLQK